jgi:hypothetical protein
MRIGKGKQSAVGQGGQSKATVPRSEQLERSPPEANGPDDRQASVDNGTAAVAELESRLTQQQAKLDVQRRELEESRAAVATREAQLDALQLEIDRREAELEDQRREIAQANQKLIEARAEVQRLKESLETQHADVRVDRLTEFYRQQQEELEAERRQIHSLREELGRERASAAEDLQRIREGRDDLDRRAAALNDQRAHLDAERQGLQQDREKLVADAAQLSQEQADMERARAELARRQEQLRQELLDLGGQRDRLAAQREQIDEQRASLAAEQTAMASRAEGIEKQRTALSAQREQLLERQRHLDAELERLRESREKIEHESEQHRTELRRKLEQLETQLIQVTERGQQLAARQRELDERQSAIEESAREAVESQSKRQAEIDAEQASLSRARQETEAGRRQLDEAQSACDRRAAELDEKIAAFAAERDRILKIQDRFDAQAAELQARGQHLDRAETDLNEQRALVEAQARNLQSKELALAQREEDLAARLEEFIALQRQFDANQAKHLENERKLERQIDELVATEADLERRRAGLASAESKVHAAQQTLTEERQRLAERAAQVEAEARQLEQDRQDAAREVAEEREILDHRREELTRQATDLTEREHRLAEAVEAFREAAEQGGTAPGAKPIVIQTGEFNLRRALVASALLSLAAAIIVVAILGLRREVQGDIHIRTDASPAEVLAQHVNTLRSQSLIQAAAQGSDADVPAAEIEAMMGPGGEIRVVRIPEESRIRLVAVTRDPRRVKAVIDALGNALRERINNKTGASPPSADELQELQARRAALEQSRAQEVANLTDAQKAAQDLRSDASVEQLDKQRSAAVEAVKAARQAVRTIQQRILAFSTSQPVVAVDAAAQQAAFAADAQLKQDTEQLRLREQQLRGYLVDGLEAARAPLATLSEKIEAFDRQVAGSMEGRPAEDLLASLKQIRTELASCREVTAEAAKAWDRQLQRLRQRGGGADGADILAEQQQAEKLLSEFLDRLSQPIMSINHQAQSIAQPGGEDMARRRAIQDGLRKQAEEMTSARREFANAGAEVIPMSSQRLDACLKQVGQLRTRVAERRKQIAAAMEQQASNQSTQQRERQLADLRRQADEAASAFDRASEEHDKLDNDLHLARTRQVAFEQQQKLLASAEERIKGWDRMLAELDRQIDGCRKRAASRAPSQRNDTAEFFPADVADAVVNRNQLLFSAAWAAVLTFLVTWSVTWIVAGGPQRPSRRKARAKV